MLNGAKVTKELLNALDSAKKPQTNADRIRAMSDDELAMFCNSGFHCLICSEGDKGEKGVCDVKCDEHCLEWLKQPAKEELP